LEGGRARPFAFFRADRTILPRPTMYARHLLHRGQHPILRWLGPSVHVPGPQVAPPAPTARKLDANPFLTIIPHLNLPNCGRSENARSQLLPSSNCWSAQNAKLGSARAAAFRRISGRKTSPPSPRFLTRDMNGPTVRCRTNAIACRVADVQDAGSLEPGSSVTGWRSQIVRPSPQQFRFRDI
jgi:hypothetical protein